LSATEKFGKISIFLKIFVEISNCWRIILGLFLYFRLLPLYR